MNKDLLGSQIPVTKRSRQSASGGQSSAGVPAMGEADSALSARIAFAPWPLMISSDTKLCISLSCASVERKG